MPERLRYFTMGNALVVPLVKAMGKRISALAEDEYGNTPEKIIVTTPGADNKKAL